MKKLFLLFLALFNLIQASPARTPNFGQEETELLMLNQGQVYDQWGIPHPEVGFILQASGMKIWFTADGIHYQMENWVQNSKEEGKYAVETYRMDMQLVGSNRNAQLVPGKPLDYSASYYNIPNRPEGVLNVPAYAEFIYQNVYPGIDWQIVQDGGILKFNFLVHPGADPTQIRMRYQGGEEMDFAENAKGYTVSCPMGTIGDAHPSFFSQINGTQTQSYPSYFRQVDDQTIAFAIPDNYDKSQLLVLDPVIEWATYYGGTGNDRGYSTAVDDFGNVYLAGYTASSTQIAVGGHQNTISGSNDGMLVKFDALGNRIWATYYGGSGSDQAFNVKVLSNSVFLGGTTASSTGIAASGQQNSYGGTSDAFLIHFNSAGVRQWGTYFGGGLSETGLGLDIAENGDLLIGGSQASAAYMTKYNAAGVLQWTRTYTGSGSQDGNGVAFDKWGNCYLAGSTSSSSGFSLGGFQPVFGGGFWEGFLAKANAAGTNQYITYYGAAGDDKALSVATDTLGNVYLAGTTNSSTGISSGGHQMAHGGGLDGFLVKFDSAGARIWGTYYGGGSNEGEIFVKRDFQQNVYLGGATPSSNNIATAGSLRPTSGGSSDAFLAKFTAAGTRLWGTYYGGTANDYGWSAGTDDMGTVYLCGYTRSTNGIAIAGFQNSYTGQDDAFLVKIFDGCLTPPTANCQTLTVDVTAGSVTLNASQVDNGSVSGCGNAINVSIPPTTYDCADIGPQTVVLTVTDAGTGATANCTASITVTETLAPTAVCQNLTLYLDGSGQAQVIPSMVDNGSVDNCGIDTMFVDSTLFTCNSLSGAGSGISDLFFSEYMEGTSNNKCVEIFNGTGAPVDLAALGYAIRIYFNGATTFTSYPLTGTIAPGDVHVFCHSTSFPATLAQADQTTPVAIWTGDDAVVLMKGTQILDIIGCIGEDPGSGWTDSGLKTLNQTLVRKSSVTSGVFINPPTGFPTLAAEWNTFPIDNIANLGQHTVNINLPSLTLTVVDGSGNMSTCTAQYTLADTSTPSISCQPVTLYLGSGGTASLSPSQISPTISDNCGIASTTLSRSQFDCLDVNNGGANPNDLFFSEYMEGTNNNKCIEIYNGTANPIDLGTNGYAIRIYFNGSTLFNNFPLSGIVASGDVFVFCHSTSLPTTLAQADQTTNLAIWTGDDAIVLAKGSTILDIFGRIGEDPGSGWSISGIKTINQTVVRKPAISQGITVNPAANFPTLPTEWNQLPIDDISNLGSHTILTGGVSAISTLTVTDANGNASACTVNVTVLDTLGNCRVSAKADIESQAVTEPEARLDTDEFTLQVFPNPFSDGIQFEVENTSGAEIEWMITDLAGRIVVHQHLGGTEGKQTWKWNPGAEVANGLYLYRIQQKDQVKIGRIERIR